MIAAPILTTRDRCRTYLGIEESPEIAEGLEIHARQRAYRYVLRRRRGHPLRNLSQAAVRLLYHPVRNTITLMRTPDLNLFAVFGVIGVVNRHPLPVILSSMKSARPGWGNRISPPALAGL